MTRNPTSQQGTRQAPLRTFSDNPGSLDCTKTSRLSLFWYLSAPVLAFTAIGCLGIVAVWAYYTGKLPGTTTISVTTAADHDFCREDGSIDQDAFIATYLETKGIKPNRPDRGKFQYRGAYARGNEMIGFTGSADLIGNAKAEMAWGIGRNLYAFGDNREAGDLSELEVEDRLAVNALSALLMDPIVIYSKSPEDFIIQTKYMQELGREVVAVELVHAQTSVRHSLIIDRNSLAIEQLRLLAPDGEEIRLRLSSYRNVGGVNLPHRISGLSARGDVLPIELTQLHRL